MIAFAKFFNRNNQPKQPPSRKTPEEKVIEHIAQRKILTVVGKRAALERENINLKDCVLVPMSKPQGVFRIVYLPEDAVIGYTRDRNFIDKVRAA